MSTLLLVESGIHNNNMNSIEMFGPPREAFEETRIVDHFLQSFKGLDCSKCNKHFGYQDRADPDHLYCSQYCLTFGKYDLQQEFSRSGSSSDGCYGTMCGSDCVLSVPSQENTGQSCVLPKPNFLRGLTGSSRGGHNTSRGGGHSLRSIQKQQNVDQSSFYTSSMGDSHHDIVDGSPVIKAPKVDIIARVQDTMEQNTEKSSQSVSQSSSVVAQVVTEEHKTVVPDAIEQMVITQIAKNGQDASSQKEIQSEWECTPKPTTKVDQGKPQEEIQTEKATAKDTLTEKEAQPELKNVPVLALSSSKPPVIASHISSWNQQKTIVLRPTTQSKPAFAPPLMKVIYKPDTISTPVKPVGHQESLKQDNENLSSKTTAVLPPKLMPLKKSISFSEANESPKVVPKPITEKKYWTINDVAKSSSLKCVAQCTVAFIWNVTKYQLHAKDDEEAILSLQDEIEKYCKEAARMDRIPSVDEIVFAPYEDVYYRGKVTNVDKSDGTVDVEFLDYGDEKTVKVSDCREPKDELMKEHPIYGAVFTLTLKNEVPESIKNALLPEEIVTATNNDVFFVNENLLTGDEWTGKLHVNVSTTINDLVDKIMDDLNEKVSSASEIKSDQQAASSSANVVPIAKWTINNVKFSNHLRSGAHVHLSFPWNLSKLNMTSAEDANNLEYLQKAINEFVPNASGMTRTPAIHEIVIAPYDGIHYRGRVSEIDGTDIRVIFIDYGDSVTLKVSDLKEPTDEIMKHPVYGCCMKMVNVSSEYPWIDSAALTDAFEIGGRITIDSQHDPTLWIGQFSIQDNAWSDLVNEAIKSQPK